MTLEDIADLIETAVEHDNLNGFPLKEVLKVLRPQTPTFEQQMTTLPPWVADLRCRTPFKVERYRKTYQGPHHVYLLRDLYRQSHPTFATWLDGPCIAPGDEWFKPLLTGEEP